MTPESLYKKLGEISPVSSSSSLLTLSSTASSNLKKRKRSTTTETSRKPDLSSRKEPAFEDLNNSFLVQAHASKTEIDGSEPGSSTQGLMCSGESWSSLTGASSSGSSKSISDSTTYAGSNDSSASASNGSPSHPTHEPDFPDPTLNLEHYVTINQPVKWTVEEMDLVQKFREFRAENLHDFSLARDGVANLSVGSKFRKSLAPDVGKAATKLGLVGELHTIWPTLTDILGRVFAKNHYDDVAEAITDESMKDPVARYIIAHYFAFQDHVPTHINELQGFADLTWPFIRGAMTMTGVETQYLEVPISGVLERKNLERDDLTEAKQPGQYANGVAIWGDSQVFLSEVSTTHSTKAEKLRRDEFKLARAMRDSWVSQVRATCKHSVPLSGIAVFGSSTFKGETKLWRLDFHGVFRLVHFNSFFVPLKKSEFGKKAKVSILLCLELAMRVKAEVDAREEGAAPIDHGMRELLEEAVSSI
ncbi:hypothetical protein KI688_002512 [Linnemannia hyalina]|uniref:Uncharacterized protein n=1 Tax=Linnemannia hyalina TaxID=64524 RepID=A0A9P7XSK6_9FUNG|nr:hypothetical protein KI688_002512 [Linnemannia hyalina]